MKIKTQLHAGELTVYGVESCPWTRKQIDLLQRKAIPFTYVDCDSNQCPEFVDGFPTLVREGKVLVGFQKL